MEFNANSSFYKFNEQWGWFGWSDGPFLDDSTDYQENLKVKHRNCYTNPEILTPYYNIGFNGVQPYIDPMAAAKDSDKGYLLYGDFNAKNYLRRFSLHVKSLNYAQWEHDPQEGRDITKLSDVDSYNTIGTNKRPITNNGGGRDGTLLDGGTQELTLLDLNTQDLYYKEGSSPSGDMLTIWNDPDIRVWDHWPMPDRTYGFGQYGGQHDDFGHYKRFASPVKGAPARIRRIPIYTKDIQFPSHTEAYEEGLHVFKGQEEGWGATWEIDDCGNIIIPDHIKSYYSWRHGIDLNETTLRKLINYNTKKGWKEAGECGGCSVERPTVTYKTGYYYTLSTAPVMAPSSTGTPSDNGLGWDPGPGITSEWAPSGGYGIIVENMDCHSCPPAIQDVVTKTYHGTTTQNGVGPCKVLELDMGLYKVKGNTQNKSIYTRQLKSRKELLYKPVERYNYSAHLDTAASNLWIGEGVVNNTECEFFKDGRTAGDCSVLKEATPITGGSQDKWVHGETVEEFLELYDLVYNGYDPNCREVQYTSGCEIEGVPYESCPPGYKWMAKEYEETRPSLAVQPIKEEGTVELNLRNLQGLGGIKVIKGEEIHTGECDVSARNYLYISGTPYGCNAKNLKVNWETGTDSPSYGLLETGEGMISGSSNLIKGHYNLAGPSAYFTVYNKNGNWDNLAPAPAKYGKYYVSELGYEEAERLAKFRAEAIFGTYDYTPPGESCYDFLELYSITGTGCLSTYQTENTIYISSNTRNLKVNWGTGTDPSSYGLLETGEGMINGSSNLIKGHYNVARQGAYYTVYDEGGGIDQTAPAPAKKGKYYVLELGAERAKQMAKTRAKALFGTYTFTPAEEGCDNFLELYSIKGTGCLSTYQTENTIYISGGCGPSITGDAPIYTYYSQSDENRFLHVALNQNFLQGKITGTGCISTYEIDDTIYIDSDVPNIKVNWETGLGTGYGLLETGEGTISGSSNLIKGYYNITGSGACPTNFLELYSITGTGCIDTHQESGYIYISTSLHKSTGNWPNVNFVNEESDIPNYNPSNLISGVYNYSSENECGFNYVALRSISGLCAFSQVTHENSILLGGNVTHYSANFKSNGGHLTGAVSSSDAIYNEISGTNLINQTYYVDQTPGGPGNPIWVSQGDPYYHAGQVWSVADDCYMVIDAAWVNANTYTAPDAAVSNGDPGWKQVDCPCNLNTFTEFKSITGSGLISVSDEIINNTPYLNISAPLLTGTGCASTFRQNIDGQEYIFVSGECAPSITGTGCTTTYQIGDTIFVSGDCTTEVYITGTGNTSTSREYIDGQEYIVISQDSSTEVNITGTGCIDTFIEDNKIYISGGKGVTGATSPNLDPSDNVANVYSGIRTGECGDELVFKSLSGTGCIQIFDRGHYIEIENQQSFIPNNSNLWHTGGGIYEDTCYFNFELKDITGAGCISTYAEDNTIYISGENCLPEGGSFCDVLVGPSDNPSWKDSESLILECLGVSWKTITMCEEDGSTSCYDILVRPCSTSTTTAPSLGTTTTSSPG